MCRLSENPICKSVNIKNIAQFCGSESGGDKPPESSTNSTATCRLQSCPLDNFYEYVPSSPVACFCAAPLRIGYRLKSPSFSYFPPYLSAFENYLTTSLNLEIYQLSIDSYIWEVGPRVRMYLKLFPVVSNGHTFKASEIQRIKHIFASWTFPPNDLFGPYELLNFTLLGPYSPSTYSTVAFFIRTNLSAEISLIGCCKFQCFLSSFIFCYFFVNENIVA